MSDDRKEELKRNVLSPSQWIRILFMVFYAIACWVLTIILTVIIAAQILISLITGRDNENLRTVGKRVSDYFHEMLDYLVYASNDKPWPFSDSDDDDDDDDDEDEDEEDDPPEATEADTGTESAEAASAEDGQTGENEFADISFTDNAEVVDTNDSDENDSDVDEKDKS